MDFDENKQLKKYALFYDLLKEHNFEIEEIRETYGKSGETRDCFSRITHQNFKKIKVGNSIPEIYVKYQMSQTARPMLSFSLSVIKYKTSIPLPFDDFRFTYMKNKRKNFSSKKEDLIEKLSSLLERLGDFVEYIHDLEQKRITLKDRKILLESLVQARFQKMLLNGKYSFQYEDFDYAQFLKPIPKLNLDLNTVWGVFLTAYINLFDEKDFVRTTLPVIRNDGKKTVFHVDSHLTYVRKIRRTKNSAAFALQDYLKSKKADLKVSFGL